MNRTRWLSAIRSPHSHPQFQSRAHRIQRPTHRPLSTNKPPAPDNIAPHTSQNAHTRLARLQSRLPTFLRPYLTPLLNAPLTHISAFLLLHELTALLPLAGLAATFHYTHWLPPGLGEGKWVAEGVEKWGGYLRRKGWLGGKEGLEGRRGKWWGRGEGGTRVVVEIATAYAITKALLPLRLIVSVWGTPWFARVAIVPSTNLFRRVFRRKGP
ncbi:hypothetical protein ACLMJK_004118 [Lecanora helva]